MKTGFVYLGIAALLLAGLTAGAARAQGEAVDLFLTDSSKER